ncbi:MAG: VOC family protein, partial [Caulobacteraceae bacterium]|nr:VOC family protein [Caulobacteraceae bacterium]
EVVFGKLYQLGYVVGDLDAAMARLRQRLGICHFQVQVRDRPDAPTVRSAKAYVGPTMLEFLEPRAGVASPMYTDFLDQDPATPRLQHLGYMVASREEFAAIAEWMKSHVLRWLTPQSSRVFFWRPTLTHAPSLVIIASTSIYCLAGKTGTPRRRLTSDESEVGAPAASARRWSTG